LFNIFFYFYKLFFVLAPFPDIFFVFYSIINNMTKRITRFYSCPAWQQRSKENINGLVIQFPSKGANFKAISNKDLAFVAKKLNHRLRKSLNDLIPHEAFYAVIHDAPAI